MFIIIWKWLFWSIDLQLICWCLCWWNFCVQITFEGLELGHGDDECFSFLSFALTLTCIQLDFVSLNQVCEFELLDYHISCFALHTLNTFLLIPFHSIQNFRLKLLQIQECYSYYSELLLLSFLSFWFIFVCFNI